MDECPNIWETIFGFTLRVSSSVAHVPEIVEADLRQARSLQERLERASGEVVAVERLARLGGEYEAVLAPKRADPIYLS